MTSMMFDSLYLHDGKMHTACFQSWGALLSTVANERREIARVTVHARPSIMANVSIVSVTVVALEGGN
jgi:hypothetical protein